MISELNEYRNDNNIKMICDNAMKPIN